MTESNKSLTLKLSLTEKPLSSIIDIDPITRLNLINEKQILKSRNTDVISTKEPKDKSFLLKKYKQIAENLNKLVTSKETQKKVTKPSKNAQTISFDPNDFVYDLSKYDNADESNHIIINNIEDSKFKINISNIINKEIEKSTQKSNSSINNISTSFKPIPSGNPTPTSFATPADKVINFNTSHANKHAKPSNDIDEQPARKRKMNAGTAVDSKRVAFDLNGPTSLLGEDNKQDGAKQLSFLTGSENNKSGLSFGLGDDKKASSGFGLKRNKDSEEVKNTQFSFGAVAEKKDDVKPSFGFGATAEKKDDAKPAFSLGASTEKKDEVKPAFSFGTSTEKKEETKPAFSFDASTENKQETKPTFGFGATAEQKDDAKPAFSFGTSTEKKEETKPAFSFGASTENKQETKPSFGFGAPTEKKEETKPAFSFGAAAGKKEDVKSAFSFGATSANPKPAADSAFSTNAGSGLSSEKTASRFEGFGASNESAKPKSRFDPTPVAKSSAPSGFNFGVNKPAVSPFGNTAPVDNKPAIASPFGANNSITPSMPGFSRFENNTPVNQQTGMPPQSTNPDVFKPVSGFNFAAPTQPNMLSGLNSSNTSQSPGQLNFNINSKFKSMSPPQQAQNFQPGAMNFSFGGALPSTNANNMNGSLPPTSNNGMNGFGGTSASGNMAFGGFGGGQQTMNNGAVNGRRIAKLRKR
ncbi:hypothetical protein FOG51_01942 [Hanseniaspora uvarum]|nr:hypothetical protein FOG51_01942 [Hanseniaspora uvarum]